MIPFRLFLVPFSFLYWIAVTVRNWFFDIGVLRVTQVRVPVVSVGNISAGGTGKTPFVEIVVRKLQAKGHHPAVLSRGYRRKTRGFLMASRDGNTVPGAMEAGDEPVQLAERLQGTSIAVDEDRVEGARRILAETSADCIVLDDGFQHRYLGRDVDIVLLTADEILEMQWMLPAGNRRESMRSLRRADAVVISKCKDLREFEFAAKKLTDWTPVNIAGFRIAPVALRKLLNRECVDRSLALNIPVVLFSGIGDPDSFAQAVADFGCAVAKRIEFPDHHWYSESDLETVRREFAEHNAKMLITTHKDSVRLRSLGTVSEEFCRNLPVYILEVGPEFVAGEGTIDRILGGIKK